MIKKHLGALWAIICIAFLTGCNGSSGSNGEDPFNPNPTAPGIEYALSLNILDQACNPHPNRSFELGSELCIQATLTADGAIAVGEIIAFGTDSGVLSVASKLTDTRGIAQVSVNSESANIGAAQLSASFDAIVATQNFEFVSSETQAAPRSSVKLRLSDSQLNATNRFSNAQVAFITATVLDANALPIADQIVDFQTTNGQLTLTQTLTNAQGVASTQLITETAELGAGTVTAIFQGSDEQNSDAGLFSDALNFEVFENNIANQQSVRIGIIQDGVFLDNQLGVSGVSSDAQVTISAGATLGVAVDLVDANDRPITRNIPVTFSSSCSAQGEATLDQTVISINGRANATYEDISCATGTGNQDIIQASVFVDSEQLLVSRVINLLPESAGSIEFVSASPSNIVLQGTGGQGSESVSLVTFQVTGAQGNALAQQSVDFSLNTQSGGLSLSPMTGLTNSLGQVSTRVTAGNVPTSIRVTAKITNSQGQIIQTQSDLLTVNTGLPDQNSISLSANNLNSESFNIDGQEVSVTARLADTFNNPVPDGTAVAFTAEGGLIQPSCTTVAGACSVTWTSSLPKVDDHRITILATAIGHETLIDSNGNNVYDDQDGVAINDDDGSGFDVSVASTSGFIDLSEAWRDDNENRVKDSNEIFLDFDSSGSFSGQNGMFDGPQCNASNCGANSLHVRRALVLITSSSNAQISVSNNGSELVNNATRPPSAPVLNITRGASAVFELRYSDTAGQPIASTSSIQVAATSGVLGGAIDDIMPITNTNGGRTVVFTLTNSLVPTDAAIDSTVSVRIVSPSGVQSNLNFVVALQ